MIEVLTVGGIDMLHGPWDMSDVNGWMDSPSVRLEARDRLGHGEHTTDGRWKNRIVRITGFLHHDRCDDQQAQRDYLLSLFHDGAAVPVRMVHGGLDLTADFRLADSFVFKPLSDQITEFDLLLNGVTPWLFSPWRDDVLHPKMAGVGLDYPLFSQGGVLTFGDEVDTDVQVWNLGNAVAYPRFVVTADAPGGFSVGIDGKRVTYPYPTFSDLPVTVDMSGSVTISGVDQSQNLGAREWAGVPPVSMVRPVFDLLAGGTGFATVHTRDTYI